MAPQRSQLKLLLPGLIASLAFILSVFGSIYCKFVSFTDQNNTDITLNFGIWYYQSWGVYDSAVQGTVVLETCVNYGDGAYIDAYWRTARAFSTMALIIGGVVTFWALLACCFYPNKQTINACGIAYMTCCLFAGLSLLFLNSEACHNNNLVTSFTESTSTSSGNNDFPSSCSMGPSGSCTIAATIFWFLAGLACFKVQPAVRPPITTETHDVTYTKTAGADGTTLVTETVVKGEPVPVGEQQQEKAVEEAV